MALYGPQLVTNGSFTTDSDWTESPPNWEIVSNTMVWSEDPVTASFSQTISVVQGRSYYVEYESVFIGGPPTTEDLVLSLGGTEQTVSKAIGSHAYTVVAGSGSDISFAITGVSFGSVLSIDNVSVKEISTASTVEAALYDALRLNSDVSGAVSERIYPQIIPQDTDLPAIRYNLIATPYVHHFDGLSDLIPSRFQVSAYSTSYTTAAQLAEYIIDTIDSVTQTIGSIEIAHFMCIDNNDFLDELVGVDQRRIYGRDLDFRIMYRRD